MSGTAFTGAFSDPAAPETDVNIFAGSTDEVISRVRYHRANHAEDEDQAPEEKPVPRAGQRKSPFANVCCFGRDDEGYSDGQFSLSPSVNKVPVKAILLALALFVLGTVLCVIGGCLLAGVWIDPKYNDRTWPVLTLGIIMFIPGSYHVRIAYWAYQGAPGFDYSDIPDWD